MYTNYNLFKENFQNNNTTTFDVFINNIVSNLEEERYFYEYDEEDGMSYEDMLKEVKLVIKKSIEELNYSNIEDIDPAVLANTIISNDDNMVFGEYSDEIEAAIQEEKMKI